MSTRRSVAAVLLLQVAVAPFILAECKWPWTTSAEVGISLYTGTGAHAFASGIAEVKDLYGEICYGWPINATITIRQTSPSMLWVMPGSSTGLWMNTLYAPATRGSCYSSTIDAVAWPGPKSASSPNSLCWPATTAPTPVLNPESPIILDLGGGGYRLTSAADGVRFDIRNDGHPVQIAWTAAGGGNAFLALDRNGNGAIDNGAELFGNFTPLRSGALAANGFEALNELDDNGDGLLDATDAAWSSLLLWTDADHDGRSGAGELQPIGGSGVTALETDSRWIGRTDEWGNEFRYMSHVRMAQGRRTYYDVFLQTEP